MKILLVMILCLLSFSGCTKKQIVVKDKLICTKQQTVPKPIAKIRVHKKDIVKAKAYIKTNDEAHRFYENQVKRNNAMCEEINRKVENEIN